MNTKNIRIGVGESHKGFTLVELIVVITILVILGTIGFVSIQGFSTNARDSVRVSDIGSIMKSIELSNIKTGSYPPPDSSFAVTYSG
jgi:prepilin-type N-terminal cleavage/methylation domain-containing protein